MEKFKLLIIATFTNHARMLLFKKSILRIIICLLVLNGLATAIVKAEIETFQTDVYTTLKGYKRVRLLKGKAGELLGYIYVKESSKYANGVLSALLVVKASGARLDTLYRIDSEGFFNSSGKAELKNHAKVYYGFKLAKELKDSTDLFSIGDVGSKGKMYSDDNDFLINWNYKSKSFEYYPAP